MKKLLLISFLLFINILGYSQSAYPSFLTIHEDSNWNIKMDTIQASEFDRSMVSAYKWGKNNSNLDSILKLKVIEFPESITLTDSCYILKGYNKDLHLCKRRPTDDRQWTDFKFNGVKNDYLIFDESGYEWWRFIAYNPKTRNYFLTQHPPIFINDNVVYSYGNYYAEGQFQLIDNKNNKYLGFETFNWELKALYKVDNLIFIEFIHNKLTHKKKYVRIAYN